MNNVQDSKKVTLQESKKITLYGLVLTIIFAFIPVLSIRVDNGYYHFGFPAEWLGYFGGGKFNFSLFGFLFNLLVFYFVVKFVMKISNSYKK